MAWNLTNLTALLFTSLNIQYTVCQNAKLTTECGSNVLTCQYNGTGVVAGVQWFNSSISYPLTLRRNGSDGNWDVLSSISPFQRNRTKSTCTSNNVCTLEINPLLPKDNNMMMACTFLDPHPGDPKANTTICLKENPGDRVTVIVIPVLVVICIILVVIGIVYCIHKRRTGTYNIHSPGKKKYYNRNREQKENPDQVDIPLQETKAQDEEYKNIHEGNKNNGEGV